MNDVFFRRQRADDLCEKFISLPLELQKLIFNYAYNSRERRGWFDALDLIDCNNNSSLMNLILKTSFDIANFETRCSHYGMSKYELEVNDEKIDCDYALYDYSKFDDNVKAANKVLLINTGFVITVRLLNYSADSENFIKPVFEYMAQDFWENPYDFVLKCLDYADGELGE